LRVANRQTVVIGGLRQRDDIGEFNSIPYLGDMKLIGRLFRARDTTVRESELVVFIMPEIVDCPCSDMTSRQNVTSDTVRCRLDQVPQAEGCPPFCRRLPQGEELPTGILPQPTEDGEPLPDDGSDAASIPSAECQFGVAGRADHVKALVADGRLRRLPNTIGAAEPVDDAVRTAQDQHVETSQR
jgi:hypothetical protein